MPLVKFLPGDSTEHMLEVAYIARYARNAAGDCAFCLGDPCAEFETTPGDTPIRQYFRNLKFADCCPFCQGSPT